MEEQLVIPNKRKFPYSTFDTFRWCSTTINYRTKRALFFIIEKEGYLKIVDKDLHEEICRIEIDSSEEARYLVLHFLELNQDYYLCE